MKPDEEKFLKTFLDKFDCHFNAVFEDWIHSVAYDFSNWRIYRGDTYIHFENQKMPYQISCHKYIVDIVRLDTGSTPLRFTFNYLKIPNPLTKIPLTFDRFLQKYGANIKKNHSDFSTDISDWYYDKDNNKYTYEYYELTFLKNRQAILRDTFMDMRINYFNWGGSDD
ncbi:hypothetical protein [Lactobacillus mulieris]|uniref:Uncharacterized protein n=1 Tax=Lactobacillus mulieris TaxID=2508708 RepID=A0AAP3GWR0_9LACO|nr:hypothetical protein [Lactobacillus mulieris]MCW8123427.1 hypothetical protein [Lactobacillus mulieris]MCZ3844138.1 hypothetical protein [Lactobacillus mulieris]MCZ3875798.1 hypothetical protein [Lactobacillus mulieris]MDK7326590.1 hypothetical protein [Lactobacillus mulieris]